MSHGFANIPKSALIKGWLLPENRKHYRFKNNAFVLESLPMMLNIWVGTACGRTSLNSKEGGAEVTFVLMAELDQELLDKPPSEGARWLKRLRSDDEFYIAYIHRLQAIVERKVKAGEHSQLNGIIQNTWEYKSYMVAAGHFMTAIKLVDGIYHPLTEAKTINGESCLNFWGTASMIAGVATGRDTNGSPEKALTSLIQMGVIDLESDYKMRLQVCKYMDSEYLKLVNEIKQALDKMVEKAA